MHYPLPCSLSFSRAFFLCSLPPNFLPLLALSLFHILHPLAPPILRPSTPSPPSLSLIVIELNSALIGQQPQLSPALLTQPPQPSSALLSHSPQLNTSLLGQPQHSQTGQQSQVSPCTPERSSRTRFTEQQLETLQGVFEATPYPREEEYDRLSALLSLPNRVIVVWFQNARQRARKNQDRGSDDGKKTPCHRGQRAFFKYVTSLPS
uniref:Homeobox domain-containing protein n=1 Tax=Xiphophorus maculatus TaxID=8083 RepID=A0A3B5Q0E9_XIPMA